MKKIFLLIFIFLFILSCSPYEKIGSFKYKVEIVKTYTGEYGGVVETLKTYHYKGKHQAGV